MRKINQAGLNLIKHFESFRQRVYLCPAGIPTIGYGETNPQIIAKYLNSIMTVEEAENILINSLSKYEEAVFNLVNSKVPLSDNEFSALVSFTYNLGSYNLQISTLRKLLLRRRYNLASKEFRKWVFAKGVRLNGLVKRRKAEEELFLAA